MGSSKKSRQMRLDTSRNSKKGRPVDLRGAQKNASAVRRGFNRRI